MFDVGFSELVVIAIVALVVIGPERLPKVARTAGLLLGRLQRYVNDVKSEIDREMQLDELKALRAQLADSAHEFERSVKNELQSVEQAVTQTAQSIGAELTAAATVEPATGASPPATTTTADAAAPAIASAESAAPVSAPAAAPAPKA